MSVHEVTSLPTAELCARVALACAGLNGHRTIGACLTHHSALQLLTDVYDDRSPLPTKLQHRIRQLGTPATIAGVLNRTRQLGLRLLSPTDPEWPAQLSGLRLAAPQVLWVAGDPTLLREQPVGVTGVLHPDGHLAQQVLELTTRIAGDGWVIATTRRPGIDLLVRRATRAMHGHLVTLATIATTGHGAEVVVSENPPGLPVVLGCTLRTPILLAAICGKVLVAGDDVRSAGIRSGVAAHALGRPLGVVDAGTGRAGGNRLRTNFGAPVVRDLVEVERLI